MAYNSISIKHYIKSHLELQREITLIELAPSPYFFFLSICLAYMNMFARFDENPAMTLRVIKETKCYGRTDGRTDGRTAVILSKNIFSEQNSFMHMFNVSTLYRQSIKLLHKKKYFF